MLATSYTLSGTTTRPFADAVERVRGRTAVERRLRRALSDRRAGDAHARSSAWSRSRT